MYPQQNWRLFSSIQQNHNPFNQQNPYSSIQQNLNSFNQQNQYSSVQLNQDPYNSDKPIPVMGNKKRKIIIKLMKLIINHNGDLMRTNSYNNSAFSKALELTDDRYIKCLINNVKSIDLLSSEYGRFLILKIMECVGTNILSLILNKCAIPNGQEEFLLNLGYTALKNDSTDKFEIIMRTNVSKNIILKNGETFLTNLLKTNEDENVVKKIIESRFFNLNAVNNKNETVLMVACEKLNLSIVRLLLQYGSDVTLNNYGAVQLTLNAKFLSTSKEKESISNEIMDLLMNAPKNLNPNPNDYKSVGSIGRVRRHGGIVYHNTGGEVYVGTNLKKVDIEQDLLSIIELLVAKAGDIISVNDKNVNVLSLTYNLSDKSFFGALLENAKTLHILSNECGMNLLLRLISNKNWDILMKILQKLVINHETNKKLLQLAPEVLKHEKIELFFKMMEKCYDPNEILTNGETLLTDLFMKNISEEIIFKIVKSWIFDVHKCNNKNQAPLTLACSRLMTNVTKELLEQNCDISHSNFSAVVMTVMACSNGQSEEKKKIEILNLFYQKNKRTLEFGKREEIICEKRINNAVFQYFSITPKKSTESPISHQEQFVIPSKLGKNKYIWIENLSPSNFLETIIVALFAKSDNLDFLMIGKDEKNNMTRLSFQVLSWKIVFPLREFGFVGSERINELVQSYNPINLFELQDPSIFLSKLVTNEKLLDLVTYEQNASSSMIMTLFVELKTYLNYITSEELLSISMIQNKLMFNKIPGCLIFQTAKDAKSLSSYKNIIPLKTIEISRLCKNNIKYCFKCNEKAIWQCQTCMMERSLDVPCGFFCYQHKCHHENIFDWSNLYSKSNSKVFMKLSSVICKTKSHYYTFVKQKGCVNNWFSYKMVENDKLRSSLAVYDPIVEAFFDLSEKEMKKEIMKSDSDFLQTLMGESVIFVYENDSVTCY